MFVKVWCWERILPVQPSAPPQHDGDMLLPYARRWTRGIDRDTESHHVLIPIRDQLNRMTEDQFRWTLYNEILHTLPHCCMVDEPLWMACVPMFCLEIVEVHSPDRVMRQFGHSQHVPVIPSWGTNHHAHDQRRRLGAEVLEMMDKYFCDWGNRHQSLAVEVNDGTSGAGYRLWYMRHGRLLIGRPTLEVDVSSGFVHFAGTSIAMSRGLFKLYSLALQWQRDTTSALHGEKVSQIVKDTLLEAGIQFREPFFEGDPLFEHVRARGPRSGRMGHRGRARGRARGCGAGGIPIPPDIGADVRVEADDLHVHQFGTSDIMNLLHMSFDPYSRLTRDVEGIGHMSYESTIDVGDYIPDIAGTSGTVRFDTEDTTIYNTQDFIEGLFDDPIKLQGLSGQYFSPPSGLNCPK
ncbi:uncharacterized protein [Solanum lycopersicum]|uniref:uncharacterized protein isoform X5 n=1 Tax=Solanum lycopersicum TaxID=4081 RepID=UPI000532F244|nr:uncharacterized protein LOC101260845 isoform X4 [Solanum lycopersicum]